MPGNRRRQTQQTLEVSPKYTLPKNHRAQTTQPNVMPTTTMDLALSPAEKTTEEAPRESTSRGGDHPCPSDGEWRSYFLAALRECANVRMACDAVGISRKA